MTAEALEDRYKRAEAGGERTLAWLMHARRHARDYERLVQHSEALITWAAITLMTRRLSRSPGFRTERGPATIDLLQAA